MNLLFQEGRIGTMTVRNRIVMAAMHLGYADENGFVTDRLIRYYEECAKGETGLIVVGGFKIHKLGGGGFGFLSIENDSYIPKMKELNAKLQSHGTKTTAQIFHAGRYAFSFLMDGEQSVSASEVPSKLTRETPRALPVEEIKEIIGYFADAALRAREAGFDSVEIIGSTGYLVSQFLSPISNLREDEYGGSLENRARFGMEVIEAVKEACGADYPLIMRHTGAELMEGGNSLEDSVRIAKLFEQAGADAISIQVGWHESKVPTVAASVPRAAFAFLAAMMRTEVGVPIMSCNRINDLAVAEQVLAEGNADFIAMARALNADPYFPKKAREGRHDEIIPCTGCNEGCLDMVFMGQRSTCMNNPVRGNEGEMALTKAKEPKKVMVIGGGPAGMEAARIAAIRGHQVYLYESDPKLGGQLLLARMPPGKEEINSFTRYLEGECNRLGVKVKINASVTPEDIENLSPDVVIVASGSKPSCPLIPGMEKSHVVTAAEVLRGVKDVNGKVVVLGGGQVGVEVAEYLAVKGKDVTILEMLDQIASDMPTMCRSLLIVALKEEGVKIVTGAKAEEITDSNVVLSKRGKKLVIPADSVVLTLGAESDRALEGKLGERAAHWVGDCVKPRKILEAVQEGFEAGVAV